MSTQLRPCINEHRTCAAAAVRACGACRACRVCDWSCGEVPKGSLVNLLGRTFLVHGAFFNVGLSGVTLRFRGRATTSFRADVEELQMESNSEDGIVILIDSQREPDAAMANMDEDVAVVETNLAECLVGSSLKIGRSHSQLEIFDRILEDFPDAVEAVVTWEFKCDMPSEHRQFGIKWRFKRVKSTEEQVAEAMLLLSAGGHGREV